MCENRRPECRPQQVPAEGNPWGTEGVSEDINRSKKTLRRSKLRAC